MSMQNAKSVGQGGFLLDLKEGLSDQDPVTKMTMCEAMGMKPKLQWRGAQEV